MTQTERFAISMILAMAAVLCGMDLTADYGEGASPGHLLLEAGLFIASMGGVTYLLGQWWKARGDLVMARQTLSDTRADLKKFQAEARTFLNGLGNAIDVQFINWSLTPAEKEIGMLILKGMSFKEIASIRNTGERTARQQARSIYSKADLTGRIDFAAFFLEDLLLPPQRQED